MTDDDIPETPEDWFKNAVLRAERRPLFYKLVGHEPVPCEPDFEGLASAGLSMSSQVALDDLSDGGVLSTVFLGLDHDHLGRMPAPLLFETALFGSGGKLIDILGRWMTWDEAETHHKELLAQIEAGNE